MHAEEEVTNASTYHVLIIHLPPYFGTIPRQHHTRPNVSNHHNANHHAQGQLKPEHKHAHSNGHVQVYRYHGEINKVAGAVYRGHAVQNVEQLARLALRVRAERKRQDVVKGENGCCSV